MSHDFKVFYCILLFMNDCNIVCFLSRLLPNWRLVTSQQINQLLSFIYNTLIASSTKHFMIILKSLDRSFDSRCCRQHHSQSKIYKRDPPQAADWPLNYNTSSVLLLSWGTCTKPTFCLLSWLNLSPVMKKSLNLRRVWSRHVSLRGRAVAV